MEFDMMDFTVGHPIPDASSGDGIIRTTEQCAEWAEKLGCTLRVAAEDELFIDIDTEEQFQRYLLVRPLMFAHFGIQFKDWVITPSKEGLPHRHVTVKLKTPLPLLARVALQAALGSDPLREFLSVRRALNGEDNVVIFFEKNAEGANA